MRRFTVWLITASLAFLIGIAAVFIWMARQPSPLRSNNSSSSDLPCPEGLVSEESQPDVPLRLSVLAATCQSSQVTSVRFKVINEGTKPISEYRINGFENYEGISGENGSGIGTSGLVFQPHEKRVDSINGGVLHGLNGLAVLGLKSYVLAVRSVTFADGAKWERPRPADNYWAIIHHSSEAAA